MSNPGWRVAYPNRFQATRLRTSIYPVHGLSEFLFTPNMSVLPRLEIAAGLGLLQRLDESVNLRGRWTVQEVLADHLAK